MPLLAAWTTAATGIRKEGSAGGVTVKQPAVVALKYKTSPSPQVSLHTLPSVSIPRILPNAVTKPSAPFAISSVATPIMYFASLVVSARASAISSLPELPKLPENCTTCPSLIVLPV